MKTVLVLAVLILIAGCSAAVPSMRYCDEVDYHREGTKVKIVATCQIPAGGALPGAGF